MTLSPYKSYKNSPSLTLSTVFFPTKPEAPILSQTCFSHIEQSFGRLQRQDFM